MKWVAFFSQTGTEIVNISKKINRYPDLIVTNKQEAKMLSSAQYKREIAKGLFESVLDFKNKYERK